MFPQGGGLGWSRYVGHLPRASVREGRTVLHHRAGKIVGDVRFDDCHLGGVLSEPRDPLPSSGDCLGRVEPRGVAEI